MDKKIRARTTSCINKYVKNNKLAKAIENEVMNYSSKYALERGIENNIILIILNEFDIHYFFLIRKNNKKKNSFKQRFVALNRVASVV